MPRKKKSVVNVQDTKHCLKQNHPVCPVYHHNIAVSEHQEQEKMRRYWQGTLQCLPHPSIQGTNEYHSQQKGCIYNTWEVMGEKEYQMKV